MKIKELLEAVIDFPDQSRKVRKDRARERDKTHDPVTGLRWPEGHADAIANAPDEFMVLDQDGRGHAFFTSRQEAEKAIPRLQMKSGMRDLYIMKL